MTESTERDTILLLDDFNQSPLELYAKVEYSREVDLVYRPLMHEIPQLKPLVKSEDRRAMQDLFRLKGLVTHYKWYECLSLQIRDSRETLPLIEMINFSPTSEKGEELARSLTYFRKYFHRSIKGLDEMMAVQSEYDQTILNEVSKLELIYEKFPKEILSDQKKVDKIFVSHFLNRNNAEDYFELTANVEKESLLCLKGYLALRVILDQGDSKTVRNYLSFFSKEQLFTLENKRSHVFQDYLNSVF